MDTSSLVLGGLSLLGLVSTVESAVKCYERFVISARESPNKSTKFAINFRIEQRKFQLYWDYMGLTNRGCPLLEGQSATTQKLIVDVVREIHELLSNSDTLRKSYGVEKASDIQEVELDDLGGGSSITTPSVMEQIRRATSGDFFERTTTLPKLTRKQTFLWVWRDEKKSMELLTELRGFNDQLWTSLAPHHEILLRQGEPTWILPGLNDIWALQRLKEEQDGGQQMRPLAFCSDLRSASLQRDDGSAAVSVYTTPPPGLQINRAGEDVGSHRHLAKLNGRNVIVEYKKIDENMPGPEREECRKRLVALMKLFARENHSLFRVLRGLTIFGDGTRRSEFGLVFEFPSPTSYPTTSVVTLESLLAARDNGGIEALGRRFLLARALAKSLMFLHASGWYHKGLRPEAIIFRKIGDDPVDVTEPWIMGFDFSRPSHESEPSLDSRNSEDLDLYTHPDRQTANRPPFQAVHDYYSLAMCLIAIGWWRPISSLEKGFRKQFRTSSARSAPFQWQAYIQDQASTLLKSLCGELYADAVLSCLTGDLYPGVWSQGDGPEWASQKAFFTQVVQKLQMCRA